MHIYIYIYISQGKVQAIIQEDANAAIQSFKDALVFYPKSAEANESLAQLLKVQAGLIYVIS
jgi:hypothetical protein